MASSYHMNPQVGKAMSPPPAATPPPAADPTTGGAQTIIITKNPDGTVTCDDGTGQPSMHQSVDEALAYAGQKLGGGEQPADQGADAGSASDVDDQY